MKTVDANATLIRRYMEMISLLNIYLNHFPRHERYALATRMRNTAYEMYDYITEGNKVYHKKTTLRNLDIAHERLRMQIMLANELGYFAFKDGRPSDEDPSQKRYRAISRRIDEIGCMIGAWIKKNRVAY